MSYYGNARNMDTNGRSNEKQIPVTPENIAMYLKEQGLDWTVRMVQEKHPLTGDALPYFATMRESDGRIFKTGFSSRYVALQHTEAFGGIADMGKNDANMTLARAGSFDGGRIVFAQADIGHMDIGSGLKGGAKDSVTRRLTFATSHDGTGSMVVSITPVRIVCRNTLTAAVGKGSDDRISMRHTQSGEDRLREMFEVYKIVGRQFQRTEATFQALAGKKVGRGDFAQVMEALFPTVGIKDPDTLKKVNEQKAEIATLYANADDGRTERDTAWNTYNAFTRQTNHFSTVRAVRGDFGTPTKEEARDRSSLFGTIADKNANALKVITRTFELDSDIERILAGLDTSPVSQAIAAMAEAPSADAILTMMDL